VEGISADANLYVRFTPDGPVDSTRFGTFSINDQGDAVDLRQLGNGIFVAGGEAFLSSRFTALFPVGATPGRSLDFYLTFRGRNNTLDLTFHDLGVLANARIEQH
jgi:hypothetical protein